MDFGIAIANRIFPNKFVLRYNIILKLVKEKTKFQISVYFCRLYGAVQLISFGQPPSLLLLSFLQQKFGFKKLFFNVGPFKKSIFLTTFYGLYFSHPLHIYYKLHFFMISTICQSAEYILELYICIQIRINQLLIFIEKFSPLLGFEPRTS